MRTGTSDQHPARSATRHDVLAKVPASAARDLVEQIRRRGYGELPGLFSPEELEDARAQAAAAVAASNEAYVGLDEAAETHGAILRELPASAVLAGICKALFEGLYGGAAPGIRFRHVLRCLSGRSGRRHNLYFHFDSYALTLIVPVAIPSTGLSGDLIFWPNVRRVRGSYLLNAAEKFVADRRIMQAFLGRLARCSRSIVRLRFVPGNLYVICGYRTLHANEAVDADALRATLVLHCVDLHENAVSKRIVGRLRRTLAGGAAQA